MVFLEAAFVIGLAGLLLYGTLRLLTRPQDRDCRPRAPATGSPPTTTSRGRPTSWSRRPHPPGSTSSTSTAWRPFASTTPSTTPSSSPPWQRPGSDAPSSRPRTAGQGGPQPADALTNRSAVPRTMACSSAGDSTSKSASRWASTISGHSSESTFIVSTQPPPSGSTVPHCPTAAATIDGGTVDAHPHQVALRHPADAGLHEGRRVLGGQLAWPEPLAGHHDIGDPVEPERAPVLAVAVVGHEVPAAAEGDQSQWLHPAFGPFGAPGGVAEPHQLVVATGLGQRGEYVGIDDRAPTAPDQVVGLGPHGIHPSAQPRRHQARSPWSAPGPTSPPSR